MVPPALLASSASWFSRRSLNVFICEGVNTAHLLCLCELIEMFAVATPQTIRTIAEYFGTHISEIVIARIVRAFNQIVLYVHSGTPALAVLRLMPPNVLRPVTSLTSLTITKAVGSICRTRVLNFGISILRATE